MSEQQYNIIFRGDIVFGFQLSNVKSRLQQLFKTDEAKINALFTGKPVVLKRNLDFATAEKYRATLLDAGAHVEIAADNNLNVNTSVRVKPEQVAVAGREDTTVKPIAVTASTQQHLTPTAKQTTTSKEDWSLAPAGINLLHAEEQHPFIPRNIDTSSLHLKPLGNNLLDASELPHAATKVNAPNFEVAHVGADLLRADEKLTIAVANVVVSEWDIAEAGADLIRDDEKQIVLSVPINIPDVGIAPAGSDLGQIKPQVKPQIPDISRIHLAD